MNNLNDDVLTQILYFGREPLETKINEVTNLQTLQKLNKQILSKIDSIYTSFNIKKGCVYKIKRKGSTETLFLITHIRSYWLEMCEVQESDIQRIFGKYEIKTPMLFFDKSHIETCELVYEPPPVDITIFDIVGVSVDPSAIKRVYRIECVAHANRNWRGRIIKINKTTIRLEDRYGSAFSVDRNRIYNLTDTTAHDALFMT